MEEQRCIYAEQRALGERACIAAAEHEAAHAAYKAALQALMSGKIKVHEQMHGEILSAVRTESTKMIAQKRKGKKRKTMYNDAESILTAYMETIGLTGRLRHVHIFSKETQAKQYRRPGC
eukprot:1137757-Pelagomonas_calceolata.AAC.4